MRLNLGCGSDVKEGYTNVDFREVAGVTKVDLSIFPWPFKDESADEILMFDFLEHFEYRKTKPILEEVWRVLKPNAFVDIQVPDFESCANAILGREPFNCNTCGYKTPRGKCPKCGQEDFLLIESAMRRLYGGQDYPGNYHYYSFTKDYLEYILSSVGFGDFTYLEEEHQWLNWNFKVRAVKKDAWNE